MKSYRTHNSLYRVDGTKVMQEYGTPSDHLPFGQWVEVAWTNDPEVGGRLVINYGDTLWRYTSTVQSIEIESEKAGSIPARLPSSGETGVGFDSQ